MMKHLYSNNHMMKHLYRVHVWVIIIVVAPPPQPKLSSYASDRLGYDVSNFAPPC